MDIKATIKTAVAAGRAKHAATQSALAGEAETFLAEKLATSVEEAAAKGEDTVEFTGLPSEAFAEALVAAFEAAKIMDAWDDSDVDEEGKTVYSVTFAIPDHLPPRARRPRR